MEKFGERAARADYGEIQAAARRDTSELGRLAGERARHEEAEQARARNSSLADASISSHFQRPASSAASWRRPDAMGPN